MNPSFHHSNIPHASMLFLLAATLLSACEMRLQIPSSSSAPDIPKYEFEATGEAFLTSALDEVEAIADLSASASGSLSQKNPAEFSDPEKKILAKVGTDTVFIYGQTIPGGYGAVVTQRYAHPKGLLLITVRRTYGKANGHVVTETKRYASYADHANDNPQQTNITEIFGLQSDTILTHVIRNGSLETYTFRLPVVTRVINPQDGSIRTTSRYASNGAIISKVTDGEGALIQIRRSFGESDGSTVTRTEYPDGSWRQVRTRGESDGTITRETTSGLPTLGSGLARPPLDIPRPRMSFSIPSQPGTKTVQPALHQFTVDRRSFSSGQCAPGPIPRPSHVSKSTESLKGAHWAFSLQAITRLKSLASGFTLVPRPPQPGFASGNAPFPVTPRPVMV